MDILDRRRPRPEAAPLIVNNTMYVVGPYAGPHPNQVFALDATTGDLKWSYAPKPDTAAQGVACCDVVTRGLAYDQGKIFLNTLDNYSVAIDANTGKEIWHTKLGDLNEGQTITMAPLVVKGKVLIGNSGGELGVRGWVTALDENTGQIVWRAYSTGPDSDVLIGSDFKPFYDWLKGKDLGVTSWPSDAWKTGGGTMWGWIPTILRSISSITGVAIRGLGTRTSGRATISGPPRYSPGMSIPERHGGRFRSILTICSITTRSTRTSCSTFEINGQVRKVLIHPARNGYMYVIDRATGEILSADPYDHITATKGVDLKTGRPIEQRGEGPRSRQDGRRRMPGCARA